MWGKEEERCLETRAVALLSVNQLGMIRFTLLIGQWITPETRAFLEWNSSKK